MYLTVEVKLRLGLLILIGYFTGYAVFVEFLFHEELE